MKIAEKINFETIELNKNTQSSLIKFVKNLIINEKINFDKNAQLTQIINQTIRRDGTGPFLLVPSLIRDGTGLLFIEFHFD